MGENCILSRKKNIYTKQVKTQNAGAKVKSKPREIDGEGKNVGAELNFGPLAGRQAGWCSRGVIR